MNIAYLALTVFFGVTGLLVVGELLVLVLSARTWRIHGEWSVVSSIVMAILVFIWLVIIRTGVIYIPFERFSQYELEDVYAKKYTVEKNLDVEVEKVREKDNNDIYEIKLIDNSDIEGSSSTKVNLTEKEYNEFIGKENSDVNGSVYVLELAAKGIRPDSVKSHTRIYRYSFLGQENFSKEEITELSSLFVDGLNEFVKDNNEDRITEEIKEKEGLSEVKVSIDEDSSLLKEMKRITEASDN